MIFIRSPVVRNLKCLQFDETLVASDLLKSKISEILGTDTFLLYHNGSKLSSGQYIHDGSTVCVTFTLPGGKGGFGSMLRAIGAQIEKTTNREACRDLSGRRLRDINEEQRLKRWISKESERETEKAKRRKERIERLKSQPKHHFVDFEYEKEISGLPERIDDALTQGLQKTKNTSTEKRKTSDPGSSSKKSRIWLGEDISSDSETSDAETSQSVKYCSHSVEEMPSSSISSDTCSSHDSENQIARNIGTSSTDHEGSDSNQEVSNRDSPECPMETTTVEADDSQSNIPLTENNDECSKPLLSELLPPSSQQSKDVIQDYLPIDLAAFKSPADLEALGLDKLKAALVTRGLKCGGTIADRAQRLWKVRLLEPHEYPSSLLSKVKKT